MRDRPEALVVGGGPAGLGTAVALQAVGVRVLLVEARRLGASFRRWPRETRLLTPSFTANGFGLADLKAIAPGTSPAFSLGEEHPTGRAYARYLEAVAHHFGVPWVRARVKGVEYREGVFRLATQGGFLEAPFLVWAVGEFSFPRRPFPGASLALAYARVGSFSRLALEAPERVVIGGYESGLDAALHLAARGVRVTVLDPEAPWEADTGEPSYDLSPYTRSRLRGAPKGLLRLRRERVLALGRSGQGYLLVTDRGRRTTPHRPLLATGFADGLDPVRHLFHQGPLPPGAPGRAPPLLGGRVHPGPRPLPGGPQGAARGGTLLLHLQVPGPLPHRGPGHSPQAGAGRGAPGGLPAGGHVAGGSHLLPGGLRLLGAGWTRGGPLPSSPGS
ncbi:NAD(P)/FAD-dependent oxidoreductase [Thermus altitudinis]|uniref:NAD(P)/FAD-dependent oxidoreductase n=1 Tax=Thermus altitudinis TaxID=2908145 RepID=UPI001FA99DBE|nr:NAD(P)/FAD-dependent oxidoreductase [Thermus altitudinis]